MLSGSNRTSALQWLGKAWVVRGAPVFYVDILACFRKILPVECRLVAAMILQVDCQFFVKRFFLDMIFLAYRFTAGSRYENPTSL